MILWLEAHRATPDLISSSLGTPAVGDSLQPEAHLDPNERDGGRREEGVVHEHFGRHREKKVYKCRFFL
jgi:hypothetical protein